MANTQPVPKTNPPEGDRPLVWILPSDMPIDAIQDVQEVIQRYCLRWMIDVFLRMLESGAAWKHRGSSTSSGFYRAWHRCRP